MLLLLLFIAGILFIIIIIILTIYIAVIAKNVKKFFFVFSYKDTKSITRWTEINRKKRGIKGYKSMPQDDLTKMLSEPKTKTKSSLSKERIKGIKEDFNK